MNWKQIEGQWDRVSVQIKAEWGKLTDDDLADIAGKRQHLVAKLQARYGVLKGDVERQVNGWLGKVAPATETRPAPPTGKNTLSDDPD